MITRKEDLIKTYIENDFGEMRDLYIEAMSILGVKSLSSDGFEYLKSRSFIGVWDWGFGAQVEWSREPFAGGKQLTIKDLKKEKPAPTKFVKVEESIFDLKEEFERGELYFSEWGEEKSFAKIKKEHRLMNNLNSGNVYRQVEIDWRDEVVDLFGSGLIRRCGEGFQIGGVSMPSLTLVKLSHAIAELTENPEGV